MNQANLQIVGSGNDFSEVLDEFSRNRMFIQGYEEFLLFHDLPLHLPAGVLQAFRSLCMAFYVGKEYEFAECYRIGSCQMISSPRPLSTTFSIKRLKPVMMLLPSPATPMPGLAPPQFRWTLRRTDERRFAIQELPVGSTAQSPR